MTNFYNIKYSKWYEQDIFEDLSVSISVPTGTGRYHEVSMSFQARESWKLENWNFHLGETCRKPGVSMWFFTDFLLGNLTFLEFLHQGIHMFLCGFLSVYVWKPVFLSGLPMCPFGNLVFCHSLHDVLCGTSPIFHTFPC